MRVEIYLRTIRIHFQTADEVGNTITRCNTAKPEVIFLAKIGRAPTGLLGQLYRGTPHALETGLTAGERYA